MGPARKLAETMADHGDLDVSGWKKRVWRHNCLAGINVKHEKLDWTWVEHAWNLAEPLQKTTNPNRRNFQRHALLAESIVKHMNAGRNARTLLEIIKHIRKSCLATRSPGVSRVRVPSRDGPTGFPICDLYENPISGKPAIRELYHEKPYYRTSWPRVDTFSLSVVKISRSTLGASKP